MQIMLSLLVILFASQSVRAGEIYEPNRSYRLYRIGECVKGKQRGSLSIRNGCAFLDLSLTNTERLREIRSRFGEIRKLNENGSKSVIDLVGLDKQNSPVIFQLIVETDNDRISKYMIEGPGISNRLWKPAIRHKCGGWQTAREDEIHRLEKKEERGETLSSANHLVPNYQ